MEESSFFDIPPEDHKKKYTVIFYILLLIGIVFSFSWVIAFIFSHTSRFEDNTIIQRFGILFLFLFFVKDGLILLLLFLGMCNVY